MDFTYIPTEYEIKLMVLYTVANLKIASNYTMIDYVISSCANVNYFELERYITDLMDTKNLTDYEADGQRYYSVTEQGEETLGFFSGKIPGSIRLKLNDKIQEINLENARGNKLFADYFPINENEYTVKFSMEENNTVILNFELYAGSKQHAMEMCKYLKRETSSFYKTLMHTLDEGINAMNEKEN